MTGSVSEMTWFDYVLTGWLIFGALAGVAIIGKKRDPINPSTAVLTVVINALIIVGLVLVG